MAGRYRTAPRPPWSTLYGGIDRRPTCPGVTTSDAGAGGGEPFGGGPGYLPDPGKLAGSLMPSVKQRRTSRESSMLERARPGDAVLRHDGCTRDHGRGQNDSPDPTPD